MQKQFLIRKRKSWWRKLYELKFKDIGVGFLSLLAPSQQGLVRTKISALDQQNKFVVLSDNRKQIKFDCQNFYCKSMTYKSPFQNTHLFSWNITPIEITFALP